jgi:biopolymer transport protein ExbD
MGFRLPGDGLGDEDGDLPVLAEINVTPLVDVMLVLLIIFMVAAPLMVGGVPVNLPRTTAPRIAQQQLEPVVLTLDGQGRVFLGEEELPEATLAARLRPLAEAAPDRILYLRADGASAYSQVMGLMGQVSAAGFSRVSLLAENAPVPTGH